MEKIRQFFQSASSRMKQNLGLLDSLFFRYELLMSMTDQQIQIQNQNESLLPLDPVYQSAQASDSIKEAIAQRKLNGMTEQQFDKMYLRILQGSTDQIAEAPAPGLQMQIVQAPAQALDKIPDKIELLMQVEAGHTERYLLAKCQEHSLTLRQLGQAISLQQEFQTNLPQIFNMLEQGLEFAEIQVLLEIRQILQDQDKSPSLIWLWQFREFFIDVTYDTDHLAQIITDAFDLLVRSNRAYERFYADQKLQLLMELALRLKTTHLQCVCDYLEYCAGRPAERGEHEYPDFKSKLPIQTKKHQVKYEPSARQKQDDAPLLPAEDDDELLNEAAIDPETEEMGDDADTPREAKEFNADDGNPFIEEDE